MQRADRVLKKLSEKISYNYAKRKNEKVLQLMSAKARLQYIYNQQYTDNASEQILKCIAESYTVKHEMNKTTVLFYDGFGLDKRGLAQIYLKALLQNNYEVVYVTRAMKREDQPQIMSILDQGKTTVLFDNTRKHINKIDWLQKIIATYAFDTAFLYTTPWDVDGIVAFNSLKEKCVRYQINLTDHAFWLGINAFDYCIEFRNYGAAISRDYRRINRECLLELPYYPIVNKNIEFEGFSFDVSGKKIIFSGGSIYKTVDATGTFYSLVDCILKRNEDTVFVYAGLGKNEFMQRLIEKYPKRVFQISERKDLICVMEKSYLYLNTYPISGALMLQYAAIAGCIPVSLKRSWDDDATGILINEGLLGEIFEEFDDVAEEIDKLINDENYYIQKKKLLINQVITEKEFDKKLKRIIESPKSMIRKGIDPVNTTKYRESYNERITVDDIADAVINKSNICVARYFPGLLTRKIMRKCK